MTASPYIAVVGGVNIDIGGRSDAPLVAGDSNPGRIRSSLGGVGRNIAHNLALLGAKVKLITALGADDGAKRVEASCADLGIDLTDSLYVPDGATSTYLFLADSNGDMALAMNDMAIYEQLTPTFLETKLNTLNAAALVVLDTNLSAESIRYLGEHCTAPLFADPVSAAKAGKLEPILGRLHTLKPNRMEAELPGFRKEDISLTVKEDVLTVAAHREKEPRACSASFFRSARTACLPPTMRERSTCTTSPRAWSIPPAAATPSWLPSPARSSTARTLRPPRSAALPPPPSRWRAPTPSTPP